MMVNVRKILSMFLVMCMVLTNTSLVVNAESVEANISEQYDEGSDDANISEEYEEESTDENISEESNEESTDGNISEESNEESADVTISEEYDEEELKGRLENNVSPDFYNQTYFSRSNQITHASKFDGYVIEKGIDVSRHNETVDWELVKADGIDFAIIRVAYRGYGKTGTLQVDEKGITNIKNAKAAGVPIGVYIYSQAITVEEAVEEAEYLLNTVKGYTFELPIVFDYEYYTNGGRLFNANLSNEERTNICLAFCETIKNAGFEAMVYANKSMLRDDLNVSKIDNQYKIWLAEWGTMASYDGVYSYWQYTDKGSVSGITGDVDMNFRYYKIALSAEKEENGILVSWDKVQSADGYMLYRKTEGTDYQLIHKINGSGTTVYKDTQLEAGENYTYKLSYYKIDNQENVTEYSINDEVLVSLEASGITITKQPESVKTEEGKTVSFKVTATGTDLKYQWQESYDAGKTWHHLQMAASTTSEITVNAELGKNGYQYRCVITDGSENEVISKIATLTVTEKVAENTAVVIALDPGHDARHNGVETKGIVERKTTLKIANYCKEELEKYSGVEVYLTRTEDSCPYPNTASSGECIEQRVIAAANAGANIYINFHLNTQVNGTTEIIYPNASWKPQLGKIGKELAALICEQLEEIGLDEDKCLIKSKNTTANEIYPDDSVSDYYWIHIYGKENNLAAVDIEHAFKSNQGDVNDFLKTEEGLKKLGIADAKGIAEYLGLSKKNDSSLNDTSSGNTSPSIQNANISTGIYTIALNANKGYVLDVQNGSGDNQANIQLYESNGTLAQQFEIENTGDGYIIRNVKSGKVLDAQNGGTVSGTNVWQYESNGTLAQKWDIIENKDGTYSFICKLNGLALDISNGEYKNESNIQLYTPNGTNAQKFVLVKQKDKIEGTFYIQSKQNRNYALDVQNGSNDNQANIQLYESNGTIAQQFKIENTGDGYIIRNVKSGKVLDAQNGGTVSGTNIWQYEFNETLAQKWDIIENGDGTYSFICKLNGLALDISNGEYKNESNIQLYTPNGTNAQKFILQRIK